MYKIILFVLCLFLLCGCWRYSDGSTIGYITTVEGGIFWDTVWIRAELESSQTNGYAIQKDSPMKKELLELSKNRKRVELQFKKHISMARIGEDCPNDEIVSFIILD